MEKILEKSYVKWIVGILGVLSLLVLIIGSFFNGIDQDSAIILVNMEKKNLDRNHYI